MRSLALICQPGDSRGSILRVTQMAGAALHRLKKKSERLCRQHQETGLQSPYAAFRAHLPHLLSQALLCRTGHINVGLIEDLAESFLPLLNDDPLMRVHIEYVFRKIRNAPSLREQIYRIEAPESVNHTANNLVRIVCGLPCASPLGAAQVRQAVLSGLFSYMRQGESRACFATALAVLLHNSAQGLFVRDATQLLTQGVLEKTVAGKKLSFPAYLRVGSEARTRLLRLDPDGCVFDTLGVSRPFWEAPGFQAVCLYFDIKDFEAAGKKVHDALIQRCVQSSRYPSRVRFLLGVLDDILRELVSLSRLKDSEEFVYALFQSFFV